MSEIHKLEKDGNTIWPATTTTAIVDPDTRSYLTDSLDCWNITKIWPEDVVKTIDSAVPFIATKLPESRQTIGTRVQFVNASGKNEVWEFFGGEHVAFTNLAGWKEVGANTITDLVNAVFPLTLNFTSSHSIVPVGSSTNVTFNWNITKGGENVSGANVTFNDEVVTGKSKQVSMNPVIGGENLYVLKATYRGETKEQTIKILASQPVYWGAVAYNATINASTVAGLSTSKLQSTKSVTVSGVNLTNQKFVYAYPASFGDLTSIKDGNQFEYLVGGGFAKTTVTLNSVTYNVYYLVTQVTIDNAKYIFS